MARRDQKAATLLERWQHLIAERPIRNRDAAHALGVSEAELVASACGSGTFRLRREPLQILREAAMLGRVMALTRNDSVVHEKKGVYAPAEGEGHVGLVLGEDIDLRLFFSHWRHAFAVCEPAPKQATKRSLQFFDPSGEAVHKIHLLAESDLVAFDGIVEGFADEDQSYVVATVPRTLAAAERSDADVAADEFLESWAGLTDTHQFFGLLKRFGVTRTQALRLAEGEHADRAPDATAWRVMEEAARTQVPFMVFVGNAGCIQIHTGPVANIARMGTWINVLDPAFNLHLREDHIAQSWVVRKPITEGTVTSLELFDRDGGLIAQFFGKRKPGVPEQEAWRELLARAAGEERSHAA